MSDRKILSLTVSLGLVFFLIFLYLASSLPSKRTAVAEAASRRNRLEQKYQQLSNLLSGKSTLYKDQELLLEALPTQDAVPTLMTQVEGLGRLSGVSVSHLGFALPKEKEEKVSLTVVAAGSPASLRTFLTNLESTSRVIFVNSFRFSQALEKDGTGEVTSTLGVSAFFLPEVEDVSLDRPISLDMTSEVFTKLIAKVKSLRVYQPVEEPVEVGKENLFE